jgi:aminopeptidase N
MGRTRQSPRRAVTRCLISSSPNYGDHAYAKVSLDPASVDYVRTRLDRVQDELLRELLWMSLWEMVRDRELRSTEYLAIARSELPDEPDLDVVNTVLDRAALVVNRYLPESIREAESHTWFEAALQNVAKTEGDPHIMWARSAINSATTTADVARLAELVDGSGSLPVFSEDQEMRWAIATKGIAYGLA